ncbi:hypothetical protein PVAP13_7KG042418 [Panicum virgatum]|uniref:Uncharacterized protein n=1 Tax=Panicum virgatum TaxID=38727 RepID=A0A8T0Q9X0_PANVG|nr:hypothetical protein PVAP13_7KG042418 [Panicum virgatum]
MTTNRNREQSLKRLLLLQQSEHAAGEEQEPHTSAQEARQSQNELLRCQPELSARRLRKLWETLMYLAVRDSIDLGHPRRIGRQLDTQGVDGICPGPRGTLPPPHTAARRSAS